MTPHPDPAAAELEALRLEVEDLRHQVADWKATATEETRKRCAAEVQLRHQVDADQVAAVDDAFSAIVAGWSETAQDR